MAVVKYTTAVVFYIAHYLDIRYLNKIQNFDKAVVMTVLLLLFVSYFSQELIRSVKASISEALH